MDSLQEEKDSLQKEKDSLQEEKEDLRKANHTLTHHLRQLQGTVGRLRSQGLARQEAAQAEALALGERHRLEAQALEAREASSRKEAARLRQQLLRLRQEVGVLRAARDYQRNHAQSGLAALAGLQGRRPARGLGGVSVSGLAGAGKVRVFRAARLRGNQTVSRPGHSPAKEEWEDMSGDR